MHESLSIYLVFFFILIIIMRYAIHTGFKSLFILHLKSEIWSYTCVTLSFILSLILNNINIMILYYPFHFPWEVHQTRFKYLFRGESKFNKNKRKASPLLYELMLCVFSPMWALFYKKPFNFITIFHNAIKK